jgi:hypothetical protein
MRRAVLVVAACVACVVACANTDAGVAVRGVFVVPGAGLAPGAVYATIDNRGAVADTLIGVEMEDGSAVMLHDTNMRSVQRLAVPANGQLRLKPGGIHGMIEHSPVRAARGNSVRVTFFFAVGGQVPARATVIDYAQVDSAVGRGGR